MKTNKIGVDLKCPKCNAEQRPYEDTTALDSHWIDGARWVCNNCPASGQVTMWEDETMGLVEDDEGGE